MEGPLFSSNLFSHPNKILDEHLINVANLIEFFLRDKPEPIQKKLLPVAKIAGFTHDLGKATRSFQDYIKSISKKEENAKKTQHTKFSAVCSYYICKTQTEDDLLSFFCYVAVRRHHSNLKSILEETQIFDEEEKEFLLKQLEEIDDRSFNILAENLYKNGLPVLLNKKLIEQWINDFPNELKIIKKQLRKTSNIENYITLNLLYSLLLDADKSEVVIGDLKAFERRNYNDENWVKNYLSKMNYSDSFINQLRKQAFEEVDSYNIDLNQKLYLINIPTGLGKTLNGLSFALKLKNRLKAMGINPRIIYSLPFLSIIDQNAKVIEDVIKYNSLIPTSDLFLIHHHLSEMSYKQKNESKTDASKYPSNWQDKNDDEIIEYEPEQAKILIEGWNSEIIITTFVQLFHTLLAYKNSNIRKFHRLTNSIIILDEIQAIPVKYWKITKEILLTLSQMLNSYIIIMTATNPLIFDKKSDPIISLTNEEKYQQKVDRIEIISNLESLTLPQLKEKTISSTNENILFIFNTINSAKEFFDLLSDLPVPKTYLSTHLIPKQRLKRIEEIKQNKYKIVVSTQLVEAGVDIDFDVVIRDIAPFDSIIQSAGRCNRNAQDKKGMVKIFRLVNEEEKLFANRIYDPVLIDITAKLLSTKNHYNENEIYQLLDEFYKKAKDKMNQIDSEKILESVYKLKYDGEKNENESFISDFQLIKTKYPEYDVFVEYDEDAKKIWQEFKRIKQNKNLFERRKEFLQIRNDFYNYVISVPIFTKNPPPIEDDTFYIENSQLEFFYDEMTGYKMQGDSHWTF